MRKTLVGFVVLVATLACGARPTGEVPRGERPGRERAEAGVPPRMDLVTIESGGMQRTFFLAVPKDLGPGPHPLVITAHGGKTVGFEKGRGMVMVWAEHIRGSNTIFAFPNSVYQSKRPWFGSEDPTPLKDIQFMADLIAEVDRRHEVDESRVYMSGFSGGSGFTWYVMCTDPERYAGFAMVGAMMGRNLMTRCEPSVRKPVVYIHGDADTVIPIGGNEDHDALPRTRDWLVQKNDCKRKARDTREVRGDSVVGKGQVFECAAVPEIEVWTVEGGGHCWPTSRGRCGGLDGSGLILDYWRRNAGFP